MVVVAARPTVLREIASAKRLKLHCKHTSRFSPPLPYRLKKTWSRIKAVQNSKFRHGNSRKIPSSGMLFRSRCALQEAWLPQLNPFGVGSPYRGFKRRHSIYHIRCHIGSSYNTLTSAVAELSPVDSHADFFAIMSSSSNGQGLEGRFSGYGGGVGEAMQVESVAPTGPLPPPSNTEEPAQNPLTSVDEDLPLLAVSSEIGLPDDLVIAFLSHLGADSGVSARDFSFLDKEDINEALSLTTTVEGVPLSAIQKARLRRVHANAVKLSEEVAQPPAAPGGATAPAPVVVQMIPENTMNKRKLNEFLEQGEEGSFDLFSADDLTGLRQMYVTLCGSEPPERSRPTSEQLAAIASRLKSKRAPYADFAIFGPFNKKEAKDRKFDHKKMVGNEIVIQRLAGPSCFDEWLGSWSVMKTALIMLGEASPGTLELYEESIRQLSVLYPASWGDLCIAEEKLRWSHWDRMYEEITSDLQREAAPHPGFNPDMPWEYIISHSAYGPPKHLTAHWWFLNLVGPLNSPSGTKQVVAALEGRRITNQWNDRRARPAFEDRQQGGYEERNRTSAKTQVCRGFNSGNCRHPCPNGRIHKCDYCGKGNHGANNCNQKAGKGGGKDNRPPVLEAKAKKQPERPWKARKGGPRK
jgi:hypothetical protein